MNHEQKKAIMFLHKNDIWLQDILSVIYDLRPCIRFSISPNKITIYKHALYKLGLKILSYDYKEIDLPVSVIGKKMSILKRACEFERNGKQNDLGRILGYPLCCIKSWQNKKQDSDIMPLITKKNSKQYDYKLNYLFNFDSRVMGKSLLFLHYLQKAKYSSYNKYIISHIPCSFDCKESLKYASSLIKIIEKEFPDYMKKLKYDLKKIFLVIDNYHFVSLRGTVNKNTINYSETIDCHTLFDKKTLIKIKEGNKIKWTKNKTTIYKNNSKIGEYKLMSEIIDFK